MILNSLADRFEMPAERMGRFGLFIAMAVVQYTANALARSCSEALFLAHAGPSALPLYLVIVGIIAVPIAGWMSGLIDRKPKAKLFRTSLLLAMVAAVGLRALVFVDVKPVWYGVLIGVVIVEMLLNIQFWVLLADYFTSLEQKRLIAALTVAMAAGGALGGGLANLLVQFVGAPELLLIFPAIYIGVYFLMLRLERTERPYEVAAGEAGESAGSSLSSLPKLMREYPIVFLLALVGFLDVLFGAVGAFLSFSIYTQTFPDEKRLTQFLGTLKAVLSVLQVVFVTFVTRPLIQKFGVGRMNLFFPLLNFASLLGIAVRPGLPTAIATNVCFDTLSSSLNNPVENLTYNAVPPRFLGRVRSISEGMLQPAGLTVGGLFLLAAQDRLSFVTITWVAVGLAVVHVALGWWRGRKYVDALASQLSSRTVDLASADGARTALPEEYADEVERLVESGAPEARAFGLELAARLGADRFLPIARPVLDRLEGRGRDAGVNYLAAIRSKEAKIAVGEMLEHESPAVQSLILEATLRRRDEIDPKRFDPLFASPDPRVRGLARAMSLRGEVGSSVPLLVRDPTLGDAGLSAVARGARASEDPRLVPALVEAMVRGEPGTRATALEGLAAMAPLGERYASVVGLAEMELESEDERVRESAYALLGLEDRTRLVTVARGLEDSHSRVRRRVAEVLGRAGDAAIPYLALALHSNRPEVVEAALAALGAIRTEAAADAALAFLEVDYRQVGRNRGWAAKIPRGDARWRPLELALEDSNRRVVAKVLRVLSAFGHSRILRHARQALRGHDPRLRANAVEALASIPHRRFVLPVIHLLEALATEGKSGSTGTEKAGLISLDELAASEERWIRVAVTEVARELSWQLPSRLADDPDPLVKQSMACKAGQESPMSRLLFLKKVPLFQELSLDDLLALDGALRRVDYLPEETIFEEGSVGDDFYLISEGDVSVRTGKGAAQIERARLGSGNFFGEMALFDDEPRSATCVAATACVLLALDRDRFHSLIAQLPDLGLAICKTLSQRLRRTELDLRAARAGQSA